MLHKYCVIYLLITAPCAGRVENSADKSVPVFIQVLCQKQLSSQGAKSPVR
jgi:hypothetical protein